LQAYFMIFLFTHSDVGLEGIFGTFSRIGLITPDTQALK
jgi:hypothetical protein